MFWFRFSKWHILFCFPPMADSKTRNFSASSLCGGDPREHSKAVGKYNRERKKDN